MKQKIFLLIMVLSMLLQIAILPANASNKWNYVLKNYSNQNEQNIVESYLNEFDKVVKDNWYSPVYRKLNARSVIFYLNKDGHISDIQTINEFPYGTNYNNHISQYLSELKFKPFPDCIKENKIKMGYNFVGNCTPLYMLAGTGGIVVNHGQKLFDYVDKHPESVFSQKTN